MRLAFAGTPEFAARALRTLLLAGRVPELVLTQPDRPAGRGLRLQPSAVKVVALDAGLGIHQPASLKLPEAAQPLRDCAPDILVVAAYGLILPQSVLDIPRLDCINIHASLLPRWRGAAPIQRALLAGDSETGITIMQMEAGLDTGPMLLSRALPIGAADSAAMLHDRLAALGGDLIVEALDRLERGVLMPVPQPQDGATYAAKIEKEEAAIDWRRSAGELDRQVRAFDPFPGALTRHRGEAVKVWRAAPLEPSTGADPGCIVSADARGVIVACGAGALRLLELQKAGGRRLAVGDFLHGHPLAAGEHFTAVEN
jgi:methionyl-tRNA formyltransferase